MTQLVKQGAETISPAHVRIVGVAVVSIERWVEQDLRPDDGVEGAYAKACLVGVGKPGKAT